MTRFAGTASVALLVVVSLVSPAVVARAQEAVEAAGMTLATLSADDLDALERATGRRRGVQVVAVKAGSPAAAAGVKAQNIIFTVGQVGVDTAAKAATALKEAKGTVDLVAASTAGGDWKAVTYRITPETQPATGAAQGQQAVVGRSAEPQPTATNDPVEAYFNLMDFVRTAAWNRVVTTTPEERRRVAQLVAASLGQMSAEEQTGLAQLPQVLATITKQWQDADKQKKLELRKQWGEAVLSPSQLYPPPAASQTYRSENGEVTLSYPTGWIGAVQEVGGVPMLYLGPPGTETTWEKVLDAPNSPAGALLALVQLDDQMRSLPGFAAGARLLARQLLGAGFGSFREINVLDLGQDGAVITYLGRFAGQEDERFYWIGAAPFGDSAALVGRLGGPTAQAETLVPDLHYILSTMQLHPPQAAAGGGSGAWEAAWSRVDVGITKQIWAPSGN